MPFITSVEPLTINNSLPVQNRSWRLRLRWGSLAYILDFFVLNFRQGSAKQQSLIWAFGTTRPGADASSTLQQHLDSGTFTLDLTKTLSSNNVTTPSGPGHIPFLPYEKMIIAHAVVVTFGFLFVLPGGVLLARYTRTISPRWYTGHWILQLLIGRGVYCPELSYWLMI